MKARPCPHSRYYRAFAKYDARNFIRVSTLTDTPVIKCGGPFVVAVGRANKNAGIQLFDYTKQSGVVKTSSKLLICTHFQYTKVANMANLLQM